MKYTKLPFSIQKQIEVLKERGLKIGDEKKAAHYLSNISYYRLRAYTYPFQDNSSENHPFYRTVNFEEIIQLYVFDRQLRLLIFNAIEKIEIALRTQIIYNYALQYGSHWHLNPSLFYNSVFFAEQIASLHKEVDRSNETFIKHYKSKYTTPKYPPSWMSLEVSSMGLLSKMFANLRKDKCKSDVSKHFGLPSAGILENWMYCFSVLRNICAHHGRIWNRRLMKTVIPRKTSGAYVRDRNFHANKIYAYICNMVFILNIISPNHSFKQNLLTLMKGCPLLQEKEMGFPQNWQKEAFWK